MAPRLRLPRRAGRRTNLGLLTLLVVAGATGLLAYGVGTPGPAAVVVAVHGAAGLGLLLLVPLQAVVGRRGGRVAGGAVVARGGGGLPGGGRAPAPAVALGVLVGGTVLTGLLHAAGVAGPWPAP